MSADTTPPRIRRSVRSHRIPGICLSLLGFLLTFAAIMMLAMGQTIHSNNSNTRTIGGAITLILGVAIVSAGFAFQYVRHRDWKRRQQARQQRRNHTDSEDVISSRAQIYMDGEIPCTSGSMINLGIEEEGAQWHYDPYAGAVIRDEDDIQYRGNFEEVDSVHTTDAASYQPKYDIFTVTPSPDVIVVHNEEEELRSRSMSPSIICHHVIDDLSDSDDDQPAQSTDTASELNAKQLVNSVYSPKLTKRSLLDIGSQLEHEHEEAEKSRSPSPFHQSTDSPRPSSGVSSSLYSDESSIDLPVIKRKQRRKAPLKPIKSLDTSRDTTYNMNSISEVSGTVTMNGGSNGIATKSPRGDKQDLLNSPTHSPKGKATHGSCIKSSKNITKQRHVERSTSDESDPQQNVLNGSEIEMNTRNANYNERNSNGSKPLETSINNSHVDSAYPVLRQASNDQSDWDSDSFADELNHSVSDSNTNSVTGARTLGRERPPPLAATKDKHATVGKHAPGVAPGVGKHVRHMPPTGSYTDDHESGSDWDSDVSVRDMIQPQRSLETCDSRCS